MMRERMPGLPADDLADGLAAHLRAWSRALGAPEGAQAAAARAALALTVAIAEGHVCVPLADLAQEGDVAALRDRLFESGVVGTPGADAPTPLMLDAADRLYLHRHFAWERRLATALRARAAARVPVADAVALRARLDELFATNRARLGERADWQKLAVALALERRLTVISGGPGTGKTTTVAALLACLLDAEPALRIALAAPTGKAAARMLDALRARAAHLPETLRERLPNDAFTIHRLLGVTPEPGRFRHHGGNPLALDVLVVDEASMLDLALATRLVDALPPHARLILLGDKDQLAAVEAGAVFAELSADATLTSAAVARLAELTGLAPAVIAPPAPRRATPLADCAVWFSESHRFSGDSGIGRLAAGINVGGGEATLDWLRAGGDASVRWLADAGASAASRAAMEAGYVDYFDSVRAHRDDPAPVFAAFDRFRVLCAVHDGPRGVVAVNDLLARHARAALAHPADPGGASPWFPGRPVIVLRNDYLLRLYNGDIGICLPDAAGELQVWFPEFGGTFRALAPVRLPEHATAFAMTVHKSQGSEFAEVLMLLPDAASRVMTRELLYTGVTRAAQAVTVAGPAEVFVAACANPTARHSGLIDRFGDAGG